MSNVQSRDLYNGELTEEPRSRTSTYVLAMAAALVFAALWWLPTAKTTVDGWILLLNLIGGWFGNAWDIARPVGWWAVGAAVVVGFAYSRIETVEIPQRAASWLAWLGWLFIAASDVVTTGVGVLLPPPDAWPIHLQLAANPIVGIVVVLASTFCPDWIIFSVLKKLLRKR